MIYPPEDVLEVEGVVLVVAAAAEEGVLAETWVLSRLPGLSRQQRFPNSYGSKKSVLLINTEQSLLIFGLLKVTCC
jgi:hypothetical protein